VALPREAAQSNNLKNLKEGLGLSRPIESQGVSVAAPKPPDPDMQNPATVVAFSRADAGSGRAGTDKQASDYYRLASRVGNEPEAYHHPVYFRSDHMGSIIEIGGSCFAFGALDQPLGEHRNRKVARAAIYREFK